PGRPRRGRLPGWLAWVVAAGLLLTALAVLLNGGRRPPATPRPPVSQSEQPLVTRSKWPPAPSRAAARKAEPGTRHASRSIGPDQILQRVRDGLCDAPGEHRDLSSG